MNERELRLTMAATIAAGFEADGNSSSPEQIAQIAMADVDAILALDTKRHPAVEPVPVAVAGVPADKVAALIEAGKKMLWYVTHRIGCPMRTALPPDYDGVCTCDASEYAKAWDAACDAAREGGAAMNENECEVDGVRYVAKEGMATPRCMGCAAEGDTGLCSRLEPCGITIRKDRRSIIWVKADAKQEAQAGDAARSMTARDFVRLLIRHNVIAPEAIEDAEGFDGGVTRANVQCVYEALGAGPK